MVKIGILLSSYLILALAFSDALGQHEVVWREVDEGLNYAEYTSPMKSNYGDNLISILKVDPSIYHLDLFSAKEPGEQVRRADEWARDKDLIAVFNAGMFLGDYSNAGYMRDYDFVNNASYNRDNAFAAFNPVDDSVPAFQIVDRQCEDWEDLSSKYQSISQSIRMVDCYGANRWSLQPKMWSMVILAEDPHGNALFIFTRSPYRVHDFVNTLLETDLGIQNAM